MILLVATALAAPVAECARSYDTGELRDALASAESAFSRQDAPGFGESMAIVRARVACFREPFAPPELARLHLAEALAAFLTGNEAATAGALAAMAASSPGYQVPLSLVPDGHPVREAVARAGSLLREPGAVPLREAESGWFEVDGVHAKTAPLNRPFLAQQIGSDGAVVETRYVATPDALGDWLAAATPSAAVAPVSPPPRTPVATSIGWQAEAGLGGGALAAREVSTSTGAASLGGFGGIAGQAAAGLSIGTRWRARLDLGWTGATALGSEVQHWNGALARVGLGYQPGQWSVEVGADYAYLYARDVGATGFMAGELLAPGAHLAGTARMAGPLWLVATATGLAVPGGPAGWGTLGLRWSSHDVGGS